MKIQGENIPVNSNPGTNLNKVEATQAAEKTSALQQARKADRIEISEAARKIAELTAAVSALDDVREDRIAELRKEIESGRYHPDAAVIAKKILSEL